MGRKTLKSELFPTPQPTFRPTISIYHPSMVPLMLLWNSCQRDFPWSCVTFSSTQTRTESSFSMRGKAKSDFERLMWMNAQMGFIMVRTSFFFLFKSWCRAVFPRWVGGFSSCSFAGYSREVIMGSTCGKMSIFSGEMGGNVGALCGLNGAGTRRNSDDDSELADWDTLLSWMGFFYVYWN